VEIDPRFAEQLRALYYPTTKTDGRSGEVGCGDYLTLPEPTELYDTALMNPPYEDGLDGRFVEKAMAESRRVVALLRLDALGGKGRHGRVWARESFGLAGLVVLVGRPDFGGPHGAMGDYCVIDLRRGWSGDTRMEWWV
jgi:hypothetical protein